MPNWNVILFASAMCLASVGVANAQSSTFPVISGKDTPLTLHIKDLDANWRVFTANSGSYGDLLTSAMTGGSGGKVYTKGDTVTVGAEVFLVTYKPDGPDMKSMFANGKPPQPKPLSPNTVIRLSLLNLHALSAMDGIRVFDLKEETAAPTPSAVEITTPEAAPASTEPVLLSNGSMAPDFVVSDDKGTPVKLSSYRGKVVVLDFWSTWCGPCQESLPSTNALAAKYASKNVVVLGVNVWDTKQAFHDWLPKHKSLGAIKFAIDPHGQPKDVATSLYHVSGIPTQYVIDRRGKITKSIVGFGGDDSDLANGIKAALSQ